MTSRSRRSRPRTAIRSTPATPRSTACRAPPPRSRSRWATSRTAKALLPTGNIVDVVAGHRATLIDNGMPVVLLAATEFGVTGDESPDDLEAPGRPDRRGREGAARGRPADGTRGCLRPDGSQDVPALGPASRRCDRHPRLHPEEGAHLDRRAHGRVDRGRRAHPGHRRRRPRGAARRRHHRARAPDRHVPGQGARRTTSTGCGGAPRHPFAPPASCSTAPSFPAEPADPKEHHDHPRTPRHRPPRRRRTLHEQVRRVEVVLHRAARDARGRLRR